MKRVYIDESEDEQRFVVGGLIIEDNNRLLSSIYRTRKYIKSKKGIPNRIKQKLLNELKEHFLHRRYNDIKKEFIKNLLCENKDTINFFGAYYAKRKYEHFDQERKEKVYEACIIEILNTLINPVTIQEEIDNNFSITYDQFGGYKLNIALQEMVQKQYKNICIFKAGDSQVTKELQVADIIVGCLRRALGNEDLESFELIQDHCILIPVKSVHIEKRKSSKF